MKPALVAKIEDKTFPQVISLQRLTQHDWDDTRIAGMGSRIH
jgi:hypothetical protein